MELPLRNLPFSHHYLYLATSPKVNEKVTFRLIRGIFFCVQLLGVGLGVGSNGTTQAAAIYSLAFRSFGNRPDADASDASRK